MWCKIFICLFGVAASEMTAPGIDRDMADGVKSLGYTMLYGDEDMNVVNEVVSDLEKTEKTRFNLNQVLPPLPANDVKCLMSVDRYCSEEMGEMKSVLVKALRDDCQKCTSEQKERAGRIAAAMMAHDPAAWKTFLTRCALLSLPQKTKVAPKKQALDVKAIGAPEEVTSEYRHTKPGFKVRVKRYVSVEVPNRT